MEGARFGHLVLAWIALIIHSSHVLAQKTSGCSGLDTFVISLDYATEPKSLSVKAVSSLGECLTLCKVTSQCQASNFYSIRSSTSPICELLASKQTISPNNSTLSPLILKMYYAERICLPITSQQCQSRTWLFEKIPETKLQEIKSLASYILDTRNGTLQDCLLLCMRTEFCEAAIVKKPGSKPGLPDCQLISVSRHTVRNADHYFRSNSSFDMYESNCRNGSELEMDQPKSGCTYANDRLHYRSPVKLYDQKMNGIRNRDECQSLCSDFRQAPCRLFTFDRRQNTCYLSHSRPDTDLDSQSDMKSVQFDESGFPEVLSAELDDCVQFDLICSPAALIINVSMSRMFRGSFGILRSDRPDCRMAVDNEQRFHLSLNYADCDVKKERSGIFSTVVSLKYGTSPLFTYKDRQVKLICRQNGADLDEIAVTTQLHVNNATSGDGHDKMSIIAASQSIPIGLGDYELKILDLNLQPVTKVQPGQEGFLEVTQLGSKADPLFTKDIVITNLVASSVQRGEEVSLLDDRGCSLLKDLIKPFEPVDGARIWRARIRYFAFNDTSNKIHFTGQVKPCLAFCEPKETKCKDGQKAVKPVSVRLRREAPSSDSVQPVQLGESVIGEVILFKVVDVLEDQENRIDQRR